MAIFKQLIDVMGIIDPETKEDQEFGKPYLLLLTQANTYSEEQEDYREFDAIAIRGRRVVYDFIHGQLGNDDLIHSYIMSGKIPLGSEVSLYTFMRLCITKYFPKSTEGLTLDELNALAYETSDLDPETFNLDVLFNREANRKSN